MKTQDVIALLNNSGVYPDKVSKSKDIFTLKQGYFYRHGQTPELWAEAVSKAIPQAKIIDCQDNWRPWPKDSDMTVKFSIN